MNSQSNKKKLEIGKTYLGDAEINYKNEKRIVQVYYGNYINRKIDGKFVNISTKRYDALLNSFLEQNGDYYIPTQEERIEAINKVKQTIEKYQSSDEMINGDKKTIKNHVPPVFGNKNNDGVVAESQTEKYDNVQVVNKPLSSINQGEEMVSISKTMLDGFLEAQKKAEEEIKKDKEISKLNNKIAELNKDIKDKEILLKREKLEKNKEFNEKLDDKLFSALIVISIIQSVVLALFAFISLYIK